MNASLRSSSQIRVSRTKLSVDDYRVQEYAEGARTRVFGDVVRWRLGGLLKKLFVGLVLATVVAVGAWVHLQGREPHVLRSQCRCPRSAAQAGVDDCSSLAAWAYAHRRPDPGDPDVDTLCVLATIESDGIDVKRYTICDGRLHARPAIELESELAVVRGRGERPDVCVRVTAGEATPGRVPIVRVSAPARLSTEP